MERIERSGISEESANRGVLFFQNRFKRHLAESMIDLGFL